MMFVPQDCSLHEALREHGLRYGYLESSQVGVGSPL